MFKNRGLGLFLDNDVEEDMRRINFTIPMVSKIRNKTMQQPKQNKIWF